METSNFLYTALIDWKKSYVTYMNTIMQVPTPPPFWYYVSGSRKDDKYLNTIMPETLVLIQSTLTLNTLPSWS